MAANAEHFVAENGAGAAVAAAGGAADSVNGLPRVRLEGKLGTVRKTWEENALISIYNNYWNPIQESIQESKKRK